MPRAHSRGGTPASSAGLSLQSGLPWRPAARIAGLYGVVAAVWILLSDRLLASFVSDPATLTRLQTWKGWFFVAGSALLIFALVARAVRATRESEGRFQSLVEQSLVGVYLIRDGALRYVNPRLAEIFGYSVAEMLGRRVEELVAAPERDKVRENLRAREEGRVSSMRYEFTGLRKDGGEIHVEVFGRRTWLADGPGVMGVLVDRTEARRLEDQIRQAQRMEAVGQLTGAVAHDFNNLLTAIITPLELVLGRAAQDGDGREELDRELRQVRATALSAAGLTRKLLAFSRKQVDHPRVVDLNEAVRGMRALLERLLPAPVGLELKLGELRGTARIDPSALEQILLNLVVNAADAMPEGGTVTVSTGFQAVTPEDALEHRGPAGDPLAPGPYLRLQVSDTGQGMDAETRRRIFEPFFTTKEGGTGLGLATVFGQTKQAGGEVLVESEPGRGTAFRILLPALDEAAADDEPDPSSHGPGATGGRIMVVEDDPQVGKVVVEALRRFGHEPVLAASREEAVELAGTSLELDLLLTDLSLPDGTGLDVARLVCAHRPGLRVLFMSGFANGDVVDRDGEPAEAMEILEKPFSLDTLRVRVEGALAAPPWHQAAGGT